MDPLSVIASITGILAVAAKITTTLAAFIEKDRDAPKSIRRLLTELSDLRVCLDQLAPFIRGIKNVEESRKDGISVEQVVVISTSLVLNISELDKMLDSFGLEEPMSTIARLRWTKNEEKVDKILTHIRASKSSLSLILTIFTCASTQAAQTLILNLTSTVEQILQTSEDVSRRVASIETRFATPSRYPDSISRAAQNDNDTSTIISSAQDNWDHDSFTESIRQKGDREERPPEVIDVASSSTPKVRTSFRGQHSSSSVDRRIVLFDPTLESELYTSRVYSRNTHRHSMSSLFSTENSAIGFSFLSGLSLAQISNLSVISLPIFCQELWNPQQYEISQTSRRGTSLVAEEPSKLRRCPKGLLEPPPKVELTAESTRSAQTDQIVKPEKGLLKREGRIVLLGAADSGKSTVRRQMQLLYGTGFTLEDRRTFRQMIYENIIYSFYGVFNARRKWGVHYETKKSLYYEQIWHQYCGFVNVRDGLDKPSPETFLASMRALFADGGFQRVAKRGNEYAFFDNVPYYFKNVDSLFSPEYLPSDQDVLHTYMKTARVVDNRLKLGNLDCLITDGGGTHSYRGEWVCLSNAAHCVIFTASLSGYDRCFIEDKLANQTEKSLWLFDSLLSLTWPSRSTVVLLLSKLDLFQEKLPHSPVGKYFPDYIGADDDSEVAQKFFVDKYLTIARKWDRNIRIHCTDMTDTDSVRSILKDIEASIQDHQDVDGEPTGR